MKKAIKKEILEMLSENLQVFYPSLKNHFMCPTCLRKIPLNEKHNISEAHIIPKAAGGRLKTYLCCDCNSIFGTKQDKWFGELIRIANDKNASLLSTAIKEGYFMMDDMKINGHWMKDQNSNFSFYIHTNRNSPQVNKLINEKFGKHPSKIQLSIPLPILRNQNLIDIGFLTAGYLMWFGALGYSWILQKHLDPIRNQILNPDKKIISHKYLFTVNRVDWKPWFGIVPIDGNFAPAFGIKKYMVVFPPRGYPNFYDNLGIFERNIKISDIKPLAFSENPFYGPPVVVIFDNKILVAPDLNDASKDSLIAIIFTSDSKEGKVLKTVSKVEFEQLKKEANVKVINIKLDA